MDRVDKYKRIEDDQQQGKGKAKVIPQEMRDFRSDRYNNNRPRRDYGGQSGSINTQAVNTVFREPIRQVLEKIKNKPFFKWPIKWLETLRSAIKTSTTITIRKGTYYGGLQKSMGSLGSACRRRQVKITLASF